MKANETNAESELGTSLSPIDLNKALHNSTQSRQQAMITDKLERRKSITNKISS